VCTNCNRKLDCYSVCKSCLSRYDSQNYGQSCVCGQTAKDLSITLTNLGMDATFCVIIYVRSNDSLLTQVLNTTKHILKKSKYQEEVSLKSLDNSQEKLKIGLFSNSGVVTLICDIEILELDCQIKQGCSKIENSSNKLAAQFSDSNINPVSPPVHLFTDMILLVDRNKIHCHKMILGMYSNFFRQMFLSGMKESKSDEIELKDVDLTTIKNMLIFMYTGKVDNSKINEHLLAAADFYDVMELRSICITYMSKTINDINVTKICQAAILLNDKELADTSKLFMVKNWARLSKRDDVKELCKKNPDLIFSISTLLVDGK